VKRFGLALLGLFGTVVLGAFLILVGGVLWIRGSLPPLDGARSLPGLAAPVTLERDSLGIAVVRAQGWNDALAGVGYAHGQDRFFQMDLLRRFMGGELASLLGAAAAGGDVEMRAYGYRDAARLHLASLPPHHRDALEAYVAGVNAGLASLGRRPPEYVVLRSRPRPWSPEDALLAYLYFYHALSTHYREELHVGTLHAHLPGAVADFLTPETSRFDRVVPGMEGPGGDPRGGYRPAPIPPASVLDLRQVEGPLPDARRAIRIYGDLPGGSNAWAVGSAGGESALVAGDPHLPLTVPGIWYRAELHWGEGTSQGEARGVTVPGIPGVFVGMSAHLAWTPTSAMVDQTDLVRLEVDPDVPGRYRGTAGWVSFRTATDTVLVRGGDPVEVVRRSTPWGPVVRTAHDGAPLALTSPAFRVGGVTLEHLEIPRLRTVTDAVEVARRMGGPGLGLVFGDAEGRVAWVVSGVLPDRTAGERGEGAEAGAMSGAATGAVPGRRPQAPAPGMASTGGLLPESERPLVLDSTGGRVFTANQRFAPLERSRFLSGQWMSPTRASRIDALLSGEGGSAPLEAIHHRHQLDTRSLEHEVVRDLLLELLAEEGEEPVLRRLREHAENWDGRATAGQPYFRSMEAAGRTLRDAALAPILALVLREAPEWRYAWPLAHEAAFRILETRPPHLLPPTEEDWETYLRRELQGVARRLGAGGDVFGSEAFGGDGGAGWDIPWGSVNRARIRHPFSMSRGDETTALGRFLDRPRDPMSGWLGAVRAQSPEYGQSLRFVGRPGAPESAYLDLPGGQSGHPLSTFWDRGHRAWVDGGATPLAAGPPLHRLVLEPAPPP
jgi:penicillin amidase